VIYTAPNPNPNPADQSLQSLLGAGNAGAAAGGNDTTPGGQTSQSLPVQGGFGAVGRPSTLVQDPNNPFLTANAGVVDPAGHEIITVGKIKVSLDPRVHSADAVKRAGMTTITVPTENSTGGIRPGQGTKTQVQNQKTVAATIQEAASWTKTEHDQFVLAAQGAGLISQKNPSLAEVASAWALVVQEAALQQKTPEELLDVAKTTGWSTINPTIQPSDIGLSGSGVGGGGTATNSQTTTDTKSQAATTSQTSYINYLDPAQIQGAMADAWQRLLGRNPRSEEYQAFLNTVYGYENKANSGRFETGVVLKDGQKIDDKTGKVVDIKTGAPIPENQVTRIGDQNISSTTDTNVQKNIVSQRGIGQRGLQFLAGQSAMADPNYGNFQAATTYFHALVAALGGPAQGMSATGPNAMAP